VSVTDATIDASARAAETYEDISQRPDPDDSLELTIYFAATSFRLGVIDYG